MSTVYILHFEDKLHHAQHYCGFTSHLKRRIEHHRSGTGSRLCRAVAKAGIDIILARVFKNSDRWLERKIKNTHNIGRLCPICHPENKHKKYHPRRKTDE